MPHLQTEGGELAENQNRSLGLRRWLRPPRNAGSVQRASLLPPAILRLSAATFERREVARAARTGHGEAGRGKGRWRRQK